MNDNTTTQVFAERGRKGISYDWQSLMVTDDSLASLRELDLELELATSFS